MRHSKAAERLLFESWMTGHCWAIGEGWNAQRRRYRDATPNSLWRSWYACGLARPGNAGPIRRRAPSDALLKLSNQLGAGKIPVPLDEEERFRFEAWVAQDGISLAGYWDPAIKHYSMMGARLIWAAWRDRAAYERYATFAVISDPANAHLFTVDAALKAFATMKPAPAAIEAEGLRKP